jgi:hypothetical protein
MEITRSLSADELQGPKHGLEGFKSSQRRPLFQELTPLSSAAGLGTAKVYLGVSSCTVYLSCAWRTTHTLM